MSSPTDAAAGAAHGRPARAALLGGRSGLTTAGATVLVLLVGGVGGAVDLMTGNGLRTVFAATFVAVAALSALVIERHRLLSSVVLVPLVYVVLALVADVVGSGGPGGASQQAVALLDAVVLGAPVLLAATGAAAVLALLRAVGSRKG